MTLLALGPVGCGGPPQGVREIATPETVTRDDPGGDARDPGQSALLRMLEQPFSTRSDKPKTVRIELPDGKLWRRVRIWGYPARVAFRYGDDHYAIAVVVYQEAEPGDTPDTCLQRFVSRARSVAKIFQLEAGPLRREQGLHQPRASVLEPRPRPATAAPDAEPEQRQVDKPMPVVRAEAEVETLGGGHWVAAAASYHVWPGRCLVQGLAVDAEEHPELARDVVDRWVREGAGRLVWTRSLWEAPPIENR